MAAWQLPPLGGKIYAIGGGQPSINLDSCEIFDPEVNAWLPGPLLNAQRFTTAAAVCNGASMWPAGTMGRPTCAAWNAWTLARANGRW